ncbi:DUF4271 domain-containing protein [Mangrovibacterium lignilyticum]|uniref:DUF4271 domain-containing protein n=1 Tax=Mangrovibacterium lignilyticum TaxID=2668052 RepID=UPI0013D209A5|nr:DUF4271 domain-containing protein [Mangrovibacterium lignilyticum]
MTEVLLPEVSLKNTISTPLVQADSTLNSQDESSLLSVKPVVSDSTKKADTAAIKVKQAVLLPSKTYRIRPSEMKPIEMLHPVDSIQVQLTTTTVPPGLVLPERKMIDRKADWMVGVLIVVFALFATVRLFFGKYLVQLFHAAVNYATASRLFRERSISVTHAAFRLDLIFFLTASLFLYQIFGSKIDFVVEHNLLKYLLLFSGTVLYMTGKQFLYSVQGRVSEANSETQEILYNMNLYNRILGLGLIPITLILAFSRLQNPQIVIGLGVGIALVCYILLVFRGMKILVRKDFPLFYLILYLCTLEILPLFFIYKLVLV